MTTKYVWLCIVILIMVGILPSLSHAKIDPNTIVGMWLLDETKGDVISDSSGNKHDGKITGQAKWIKGQFGNALEIGAANFAKVLHADDLTLKTFTVTLWMSTKSSGNWIGVLSKSHNNPTRNYTVYIHKDKNTASISIGSEAGGNWNDTSGTTVVNDGEWHHVAISFDDNTDVGRVFTDGVKEGQYTVATKVPQNNADVTFAAWHHGGGNSGFTGLLDEIAIFNVALEEADVNDIMQKGLTELLGAPVEPQGKLATKWGKIKSFK